MAKTQTITDQNFDSVIKDNPLVLIDFWAEWCGPCRMIAPIVEEIAESYEGKVYVGKVDVDSNPSTSSLFGIRSIPTLILFKKGEVVDKQLGVVPKKQLEEKLDAQLA